MKRPPTRGSRQAPLVQVGLAALVAGSLLMFATIAFRTGFFEDGPSGVRAASAAPQPNRPVVLPAASAEPEVKARRQQRPERIRVAQLPPATTDVVVPTIDEPNQQPRPSADRHRNGRGKGHDKGDGKGHKDKGDDKGKGSDDKRPEEAKEEDDDEVRVANEDDDEDDDDSEGGGRVGSNGGSGSGHGGSGSGSGHSSGGSGDSND